MANRVTTKIVVVPSTDVVPPLAVDQGFVRFGAFSQSTDFSSLAVDNGTWDFFRSAEAAYKIPVSGQYSGPAEFSIPRLAPYNGKGFFSKNASFHQALNLNPAHGTIWDDAHSLAVYLTGTESYPEDWFVHSDGGSDWTTRIKNKLIATKPRWLMKFDRQDFFDQVIVPCIEALYADWVSMKLPGAPAILVDLCPGNRTLWINSAGDVPPAIQWDHFQSEDEFQAAWALTFRRLRLKFPNLQVMTNWGIDPPEGSGDEVLEAIHGIIFELKETFDGDNLKRALATAYKAGRAGKTVAFFSQFASASTPPTVDDFGRLFFSCYLLSMGPGHVWGGQWIKNSVPMLYDGAPFDAWFGAPLGEMREILPDVWARRFVNADVFVNTSATSPVTLQLQGMLDDTGAPVDVVTIDPGDGNFFFRDDAVVRLPALRASEREYRPAAILADSFQGSIGLGSGEAGGNQADTTSLLEYINPNGWHDVGGSANITAPADGRFRGLQMYDVDVASAPGSIFFLQDFTGLDGQWVHVFFYAQRPVGSDVEGIKVTVTTIGSLFNVPLEYGAPKLYHAAFQVPASAGNLQFTFASDPTSAVDNYRIGGWRLIISADADPDAAWSEFVETTGAVHLTRGAGTGVGVPAYVNKISGYDRSDSSRSRITVLNDTAFVGLSSASGATGARPTPSASAIGYQYFDTTLGQPIWWDGSGWVDASGSTV